MLTIIISVLVGVVIGFAAAVIVAANSSQASALERHTQQLERDREKHGLWIEMNIAPADFTSEFWTACADRGEVWRSCTVRETGERRIERYLTLEEFNTTTNYSDPNAENRKLPRSTK